MKTSTTIPKTQTMNHLTSIILAQPHGAAAIYDNGLIAVDPCYLQDHGLDLSAQYIGMTARQLVQDGILYLDNGGDGQSRFAPVGCDSGVICFIPLHLLPPS